MRSYVLKTVLPDGYGRMVKLPQEQPQEEEEEDKALSNGILKALTHAQKTTSGTKQGMD